MTRSCVPMVKPALTPTRRPSSFPSLGACPQQKRRPPYTFVPASSNPFLAAPSGEPSRLSLGKIQGRKSAALPVGKRPRRRRDQTAHTVVRVRQVPEFLPH